MKTLIVTLSITLMVVGMGCAALSQYVTPAEVDQNALQYAVDAGVTTYSDYDAWYPNLAEAERLPRDVDAANLLNQQELQHLIEKDNTQHGIHRGVTTSNRQAGRQREETLFGETGLLSLGLSMMGAGGFAGLLGLMRKRPGDITAPEMEQALTMATDRTEAELSIREKQFVQLVKGVQAFMDLDKVATIGGVISPVNKTLKVAMDKAQDKDTQAAVAVVKKMA